MARASTPTIKILPFTSSFWKSSIRSLPDCVKVSPTSYPSSLEKFSYDLV